MFLLSTEWPKYNDRSRRSSSHYTRLRPWDSSEFRCQPLADGNVDLSLCRTASLPRRYSKRTVEEPYRKLVPEQANEMPTNANLSASKLKREIILKLNNSNNNFKSCGDEIIEYLPEEPFANVFRRRRVHEWTLGLSCSAKCSRKKLRVPGNIHFSEFQKMSWDPK